MTRVLFIGLDAADRGLVADAAASGAMPNVAALAARGATVDIEVPDAFYVGAVWPSFYTACAPTRHGRYCFKQYKPGTYRAQPVGPDIVPMAPFWASLDAAGRRCVLIDIPKSRPVPLANGIQICDWGTHDPERPGLATTPPSLAADVAARVGSEPVGNCDRVRRTRQGYRRFVANLRSRIAVKERMARHFIARGGWDFLAVCFGDSHCVGHQCWHLHDAAHVRHQPEIAAAIGDPVLDVYRALDASVGRLVAAAGEDCVVFLLCSHGMGRHYDGGHLMKAALTRINRTMPFGRSRTEQLVSYADAKSNAATAATRAKFAPDGLPLPARVLSFVVPNNDAFAGIRLNIVGRETYGRLRVDEVDGYADALMAALGAITIGEGGPAAFSRIFRTESAYPLRDAGDALPDIIAEWSRLAPYQTLSSPAIGTIEGEYRGVRTGDHRAGGRLVAAGPAIAGGRLHGAAIEDIGPTICAQFGVALDHVDGRPIALPRAAAPSRLRA